MDVLSSEQHLCRILGDVNSIECPRTHYCCKWGCCISPTVQFYQMWYYWILAVILLFMLCSGGGWWYRYWLAGPAGRFPGIPQSQAHTQLANLQISNNPTVSSRVALNQNICARPCVHYSYRPARQAVMIERLWKMPACSPQPPPSYSQSETDARVEDMMSPQAVYQPYGPPPSYDSVVALTSGSADCTSSQCSLQQQEYNSYQLLTNQDGKENTSSSRQMNEGH